LQWLGPRSSPTLDRHRCLTGQSDVATGTLAQAAALSQISLAGIILLAVLAAGAVALQWRLRTQPLAWTETWGCGYTGPTPRMQYTASSFAQFLVTLFGWALRPTVHWPQLTSLFPDCQI
jgi:hydrogenase-4 component B